MQNSDNHDEHNNWYKKIFAANIKTEPGTQQYAAGPSPTIPISTYLEHYLKQHHQQQQQQQQFSPMDTSRPVSPTNSHNLSGCNSDQQRTFFSNTPMDHQQLMQQQKFQQQFLQAQQAAAQNQFTSSLSLGFNPLTPPGLPQVVLPPIPHFYNQALHHQHKQQKTPSPQTILDTSEKSTLTPSNTPPMDITPPKSPRAPSSVNPDDRPQDQEDSKQIVDSEDEVVAEQINEPIYNSHGKLKHYKCKSCGALAITKTEFWEHVRTHMRPEKILHCTHCPFVTELKHHLEYHNRKHKNLKPFQCEKCTYSCVNKSMLNSHRKSHSSVYQYRCIDCDYATKYCHSFKLHLRKYGHKPGVVLDEEGVPNPSVVIDVYGTRRGPKNKGSAGSSMKKSKTDLKATTSTQISTVVHGFPQNEVPSAPTTVSIPTTAPVPGNLPPALTINMSLQQQLQSFNAHLPPALLSPQAIAQNEVLNKFLAVLLKMDPESNFYPYWNLDAMFNDGSKEIPPSLKKQLLKLQSFLLNFKNQPPAEMDQSDDDNDHEQVEGEDQEFDHKSVDSAMDLSRCTPIKDDQPKLAPENVGNPVRLSEESVETPIYSSISSNRRKGRVLKLDPEQLKNYDTVSAPASPQAAANIDEPNASPPTVSAEKMNDSCSDDERTEAERNETNNNPSTTNHASAVSSSGNSSNSASDNSPANPSPAEAPTMFECKYCDIFFKDAVLYTIHMGYHSCDDVFKCNMCGEKCDGPIGLFVHMARNAHS